MAEERSHALPITAGAGSLAKSSDAGPLLFATDEKSVGDAMRIIVLSGNTGIEGDAQCCAVLQWVKV